MTESKYVTEVLDHIIENEYINFVDYLRTNRYGRNHVYFKAFIALCGKKEAEKMRRDVLKNLKCIGSKS